MNVLSLFDGISAGQLALQKAKIDVNNYFASEIDKYAIKITQNNFPETIQLGDVREIDTSKLPEIDLLMAGSPCQGFSKSGKGLNFDDEKSKLFFNFIHLLNLIKPRYFLLENVVMRKEWENTITQYVGVSPVKINSSLVSAQNRERLYWSNIIFKKPENRHIHVSDILEPEHDDSLYVESSRYEFREKDHSSTNNKEKNLVFVGGFDNLHDKNKGITQSNVKHNYRVYSINGKAATLTLGGGIGRTTSMYMMPDGRIRRLSCVEAERLQTFPDNYTNYVSKNQRYKALGNSWTVDVISHILKNIK